MSILHTLVGSIGTAAVGAVIAIKPVAKAYALRLIVDEGGKIKEEIDNAIIANGPKAANGVLEGAASRLYARVQAVGWVSQRIKDAVCLAIKDEVAKLEARLDTTIETGGADLFNKELDATLAAITFKVQAL